ncbi:MAG: hypothetical protein MUF63_17975 [Rhodobacteraceae bacterium]|nr:hypothetical protein [Paracoccaceae bacterium]
MIRRLDRLTTWVILVIAVLYTLQALQFPGNAKIVPAIFGGLAIVVVLVQLLAPRIRAFRTLSGELEVADTRDLDVFRDPAARRRLVFISVSLLAIPLLVAIVGLPLALPLYVAALLILQRQGARGDRLHRRHLGDVLRAPHRASRLALGRGPALVPPRVRRGRADHGCARGGCHEI